MSTLRLDDYAASCNCYKARLVLAQLGVEYEARPDRHLRRRHADRRVRADQPRPHDARTRDGSRVPARIERDHHVPRRRHARRCPRPRPSGRRSWAGSSSSRPSSSRRLGGLRSPAPGRTPDAGRSCPRSRGRRARTACFARLTTTCLRASSASPDAYTVADVAVYAYSHVAHEAGIDTEPYPNVRAWFARVAERPGYMNDVAPYGANAAPGAGRSIYE